MNEKVGVCTKDQEAKKGISLSQKQNTDFSKPEHSPFDFDQTLYWQRNLGNQAVQRLMESGALQAKLTIGQPNDKYEQEADRVADQVMRMPEPNGSLVNGHSSLVQRQSTCPECMEEEEGTIQTKPIAEQITPLVKRQVEEEEEEFIQTKEEGGTTPEVTLGMESRIQSLMGGGQPLPGSTRTFFEPRFGADFSQVRAHTDSGAVKLAHSVNARAFTRGNDIVFDSGQYAPSTMAGRRLLAHELVHVIQQDKRLPINIQCTNGGGAACNPCPTPPNHRVQVRIYPRWSYANLGGYEVGHTYWTTSANVTFVSIWHRERRNCTVCGPEGTTPGWDLCPRSAVVLGTVSIAIDQNELNRRGTNGERWYIDCSNVFDTRFITPATATATMTAPRRITVSDARRHEMYHVSVSERLLRERLEARNDIQAICPYSRSDINTWKTTLETTWRTDAQSYLRTNPRESNEEQNARNHQCTA
ncbi:MAG: DUF4157 domain-containing protein [Candidatus Aminicenantes bacterium]|nr:DUF4157 domain-containing protein [Candidatus Aminicenantes bacterium]NIM84986.1 DUF4157 domain-containing protein [Candidatus Aminicenantes bacterium]NIN24500.1 DUF4157 domain-containing protein [Candidatus Aminicenantes bacterium]NIN48264.1 DUF4157 domain-containing protein [Candidatus Aminicenantes bacterium]NIN91167.1 DUF4157 domain-containing protein [Candidatus Aminicenantes bacterium]